MTLREVLAANLKALMAASPGLDTFPKITAASQGRLSNGTLDRVRRAASSATIDTVEELAAVFGVDPSVLLVANATTYSAWPFPRLTPEEFDQLNVDLKRAAEDMLVSAAKRQGGRPDDERKRAA